MRNGALSLYLTRDETLLLAALVAFVGLLLWELHSRRFLERDMRRILRFIEG